MELAPRICERAHDLAVSIDPDGIGQRGARESIVVKVNAEAPDGVPIRVRIATKNTPPSMEQTRWANAVICFVI